MNPIPTTTADRFGARLVLDRVALGDRPELVDPPQLGSRDGQSAVTSAGCEQELLTLELLA